MERFCVTEVRDALLNRQPELVESVAFGRRLELKWIAGSNSGIGIF